MQREEWDKKATDGTKVEIVEFSSAVMDLQNEKKAITEREAKVTETQTSSDDTDNAGDNAADESHRQDGMVSDKCQRSDVETVAAEKKSSKVCDSFQDNGTVSSQSESTGDLTQLQDGNISNGNIHQIQRKDKVDKDFVDATTSPSVKMESYHRSVGVQCKLPDNEYMIPSLLCIAAKSVQYVSQLSTKQK